VRCTAVFGGSPQTLPLHGAELGRRQSKAQKFRFRRVNQVAEGRQVHRLAVAF